MNLHTHVITIDAAVVRALASHQCDPGSFPGPGGFSRLKNQHFQTPILAWKASPISARALDTLTLK